MDTINYIAYACDNNYAMQTGVSLQSLFDNNKDLNLCVFIFSDNISKDKQNKLRIIADQYSTHIKLEVKTYIFKVKIYWRKICLI